MSEGLHEKDEDLPELHLSVEMEEVLGELAEERGVPVGQIKNRARRIMKYLDEQEQSATES